MYENQTAGAAAQLGTARDVTKPLESLPLAVQRVNTSTVRVQSFLDRFHGEGPAEAGDARGSEPSVPHNVSLNQLFAALDRLEARVDALMQIG